MSQQQEGAPIHLIVEPGSELYEVLLECLENKMYKRRDPLESLELLERIDPTSVSIRDLDLPTRVQTLLLGAEITTLSELVFKRPKDLLAIRGFGEHSLAQVRRVLGLFSRVAAPSAEKVARWEGAWIEELELSVRTYNYLKRAGKQTVADLLWMTEQNLLDIPGFGKKHLREVTKQLEKRDLSLMW